MIGIIVWAILIIIIAISINCYLPLIWLGYMLIVGVIWYLCDEIPRRRELRKLDKMDVQEDVRDVSAEIEAWEKKWGRKHPSRKFHK